MACFFWPENESPSPEPCRKAYCGASRGKPSLVLDEEFQIYIGNETDQEITVKAGELCGFNTGNYEQKAIAGMGEAELNGVCFRFGSDLDLVAYEKQLYPLSGFLHHCCTVHGVADIEIANHQLIAKMYPTATRLQSPVKNQCVVQGLGLLSFIFNQSSCWVFLGLAHDLTYNIILKMMTNFGHRRMLMQSRYQYLTDMAYLHRATVCATCSCQTWWLQVKLSGLAKDYFHFMGCLFQFEFGKEALHLGCRIRGAYGQAASQQGCPSCLGSTLA